MTIKDCRLLYSLKDMKNFLEHEECQDCKISSIRMDGQKVFIVTFGSRELVNIYDSVLNNINPTLLGCFDSSAISIKDETIEELKSYVELLEIIERNDYKKQDS